MAGGFVLSKDFDFKPSIKKAGDDGVWLQILIQPDIEISILTK
jgi:hypothetical protein